MAEFEKRAGLLIVRLTDQRLDAVRAPAFKQALAANISDRPLRVLIDATDVDFIDSTGLGALVGLLKLMGEGGRVAVAGAKPGVRRLFEITRLDTVFALSDDHEAASVALGA